MAEGPPSEQGLADHLRAAIRQNLARRADYRRRGGRRAWALSAVLVAHERALLPFASLLDGRARRFWAEGIPILTDDLQPMHRSPPPGRTLDGAGPMDGTTLRAVAAALWAHGREARAALDRNDLESCARALGRALDAVEQAEQETGARLALTAHVLESAGVSAAHGVAYAKRSGGRTLSLTKRFVLGQMVLLPGALALDRLAGPIHARGVPIFIDDVPPVPFREALARLADAPVDDV